MGWFINDDLPTHFGTNFSKIKTPNGLANNYYICWSTTHYNIFVSSTHKVFPLSTDIHTHIHIYVRRLHIVCETVPGNGRVMSSRLFVYLPVVQQKNLAWFWWNVTHILACSNVAIEWQLCISFSQHFSFRIKVPLRSHSICVCQMKTMNVPKQQAVGQL